MKVIIAGSRALTNERFVYESLHLCPFEDQITEVVSGGASGVDKFGEYYGEANGFPVTVFRADWATYGKAAGPIRNKQMADYADALIYVRYESTPGTADMIKQMKKLGKLVWGVTIAS